jgi:hypothetical protein
MTLLRAALFLKSFKIFSPVPPAHALFHSRSFATMASSIIANPMVNPSFFSRYAEIKAIPPLPSPLITYNPSLFSQAEHVVPGMTHFLDLSACR